MTCYIINRKGMKKIVSLYNNKLKKFDISKYNDDSSSPTFKERLNKIEMK